MKLHKGCKAVTIQVDASLIERVHKVRGRVTLAEFMRRGLADLVAKLEKEGETERISWGYRQMDGGRKNVSSW